MDLVYSLSVIFAIISVGFVSGKKQLFNDTHVEGFELFLFKIGVPCYLFSAIITNNLTNFINLQYIYSYLLTFIIIAGISTGYFWHTNQLENIFIKALASGYVNAAIYVLPIVTFLLGDPASAILGNLIQVIIIQTLFMIGLSFIRHRHQSVLFRIINVFKNPIVSLPMTAIILRYNQIGIPLLNSATSDIGNGAAGMSLFTFGLMLSSVKIKLEYLSKDLLTIIFFKNILHPVIAVLIGLYVFNLDGYWLYSLIIAASAPTAFLVYFIAKQFAIEARAVKLIVSLSSVLSMLTLIFIILIFKMHS